MDLELRVTEINSVFYEKRVLMKCYFRELPKGEAEKPAPFTYGVKLTDCKWLRKLKFQNIMNISGDFFFVFFCFFFNISSLKFVQTYRNSWKVFCFSSLK